MANCSQCGSPMQNLFDPCDGKEKLMCPICGSTQAAGSNTTNTAAPQRHPKNVQYIVKVFYGRTEGNRHIEPEEDMQRYLNNNRIDPNRIISISGGPYTGPYGGSLMIILVHY